MLVVCCRNNNNHKGSSEWLSKKKRKMFTCINCTKQTAGEREEEEGGGRESGTPSTKEAVKSLTSQVPFRVPSHTYTTLHYNLSFAFPPFFHQLITKQNLLGTTPYFQSCTSVHVYLSLYMLHIIWWFEILLFFYSTPRNAAHRLINIKYL